MYCSWERIGSLEARERTLSTYSSSSGCSAMQRSWSRYSRHNWLPRILAFEAASTGGSEALPSQEGVIRLAVAASRPQQAASYAPNKSTQMAATNGRHRNTLEVPVNIGRDRASPGPPLQCRGANSCGEQRFQHVHLRCPALGSVRSCRTLCCTHCGAGAACS